MGKKSNTKRAEKNQPKKQTNDKDTSREALEKLQEERNKEIDVDLSDLVKMDFGDFKKEAAGWIKRIFYIFNGYEDFMAGTIERNANERDEILKTIGEKFKSESDALNEAFGEIDERFKKIEHFLFITSCIVLENKEGKFPDYEQKKDLAEALGYDWDKTIEDFREKFEEQPPFASQTPSQLGERQKY